MTGPDCRHDNTDRDWDDDQAGRLGPFRGSGKGAVWAVSRRPVSWMGGRRERGEGASSQISG